MELTAVGIGGVIFLGCGNILFASELQTYCKTACFALRNGPFWLVFRPVLGCETAHFANRYGKGVAVELTNVKTVYLDMG